MKEIESKPTTATATATVPEPSFIGHWRDRAHGHRLQAQKLRTEINRRFDSAPAWTVTGASGRRRSGLSKKHDRAVAAAFSLSRKIKYHEEKAEHYEFKIKQYLNRDQIQAQRQQTATAAKTLKKKQRQQQAIKQISWSDRLFCGLYPTGIVYADSGRAGAGDYKRLAYLNYATLKLDLEPDCLPEFKVLIEADAELLRESQGTNYQIAGNASVILGSALPQIAAQIQQQEAEYREHQFQQAQITYGADNVTWPPRKTKPYHQGP